MGVTRHWYAVEGWGVGELTVSGDLVVAHELPDPHRARRRSGGPPDTERNLVRRIAERVRAHLRGALTVYDDVALELSWCTEFQRELAGALGAVPWGDVVSYGELAALAGRPGAARAAGTFCARNRFSLLLPCHRVVSSDGIGGYGSGGVELKRRLLILEGVEL